MATGLMEYPVAKKKTVSSSPAEPKRYGVMVRVGTDFAEAVRKVCALSGKSAAEYTAERFLSLALDDYEKLLAEETKATKERKK